MTTQPSLGFAFVSLSALYLCLVPGAHAQCTDAFEPNETCAEAVLVGPDGVLSLSLAFPSHPSGPDTDCFRTLVPAGKTLEILLDAFAPPVFLLEVFDSRACAR